MCQRTGYRLVFELITCTSGPVLWHFAGCVPKSWAVFRVTVLYMYFNCVIGRNCYLNPELENDNVLCFGVCVRSTTANR